MKGHTLYILCVFILPGCLCLDPPDCRVRNDDPCDGISTSGNSLAEMLSLFHDHLCGCVYVTGDIEITVNPTWPDLDAPLTESNFSFFYHIREIYDYLQLQRIPQIDRISFPNLRIIRGENLIANGQYALLVFRSDINNLYMPKLTEITKGNVRFGEDNSDPNPYHCNLLTVNWTDILPVNGVLTENLDKCTNQFKPNCSSSLGCDYCWCDDMSADQCCQELTRDCEGACGTEGRCYRPGLAITCCNSVCAGGCDGGLNTACRACTLDTVLNGDACVADCPERFSGSVENPDYMLKIQNLCVKPCPRGTFELRDEDCVEVCPTGMRSVPSETGGMKCETCDGYYCKECVGDSGTLEDNCTLIVGSLLVKKDGDHSKLETIRVIRGSLQIEALNTVEHFPFLSNLEVVGNDSLEVASLPCDGGDRDQYSIYITDNDDLVSIDLSSLRSIEGGGVSIDRNPNLCIVGNFSNFIANSSYDDSYDVCLGTNYRRPLNECVANNITCHPECEPINGCWGTTDADCVRCANFMFNGRCVGNCSDFDNVGEHLYHNDSTTECQPCHELCNGSCSGPDASYCDACLTGVFIQNSSDTFTCLNESCPPRMYNISVSNNPAGTLECLPCSEGCGEEGCVGPSDSINDCIRCEVARIENRTVTNLDQISCERPRGLECPPSILIEPKNISNLSESISNKVGVFCIICPGTEVIIDSPFLSLPQLCQTTPPPIPTGTRGTDATVISVVVVIVVVIAIVLVSVTLIVIRYKYKQSKMGNHKFHGYFPDELEMLTLEKETLQPPAIPPNSAKLTVTPEDSLEFGKELGAGAFGTVYEGYWKPDNDENKYHVAIKVLKNTSPMANKELLQEGVVMGSMDHENVVRLYCVCMSKQLMLVSQFVPLGALLDYLKRHKDHMSALGMLQFASQIALGMAYLESKHLVHRDLAARNVLVQSHRKVKITDFGLTRILEADKEHYEGQSTKMPVRWLPPESIRNRVFTHKTDVWSYGVTVWEVLTFGARPYQGKKPYEILKQIEGGRRLDQPMTCTIELYGVLLECWLPEPESRPSFEDLHERMQEMSKDPCRFILTVEDGNATNYGQLPSNERQGNETIYETPFAGDVSLDNTLPSNASSVNPYAEQNGLHSPKEKEKVPPGSYELAVESPKDPRYVKVNVGQSQPFPELPPNPSGSGYDYIDQNKLQQSDIDDKQQKQPLYVNKYVPKKKEEDPITSSYETPHEGQIQQRSDTISDHYETRKNNLSALVEEVYDVNQSYEQPIDGMINGPLVNQTYVGLGAPPTDNYEEPINPELLKQELGKSAFGNPVYDSNTGDSIPDTHNYEQMDDEEDQTGLDNAVYDSSAPGKVVSPTGNKDTPTGGFHNATYDSTAVGGAVPPVGDYETMDDEDTPTGGIHNATYDSTVGGAILPVGDYETLDDEDTPTGGIHNATYDSTVGGAVPPVGDYETLDDEDTPTGGIHNATYDSAVGGAVPPVGDYETLDDEDTPTGGIHNATYDSNTNFLPTSNGTNPTYDSNFAPPTSGLVNATYDSRVGVAKPSPAGITNSTYDSTAGVGGNNDIPPADNYEEIDDIDQVASDYELPTDGSSPQFGTGDDGVVNETYDTALGIMDRRKESIDDERVASPYEVPVMPSSDYELPHDGDPNINIYDAPNS